MFDDSTTTNLGALPSMDPVVHEAQGRFAQCVTWESNFRKLFIDDMKFAEADAYNGYQWPNAIRQSRDVDERPCLTINMVRQHNLQILNDAKQNKPGIAVRATGNGATAEAAQALESLVRHIEYISNASDAYETASNYQVKGGKGYIRVETDYCNDDNFDQEIYIRRINDPLSVYMDPDAKEADKSDAKYAFIFDSVPKKDFDKKYPKYKGQGSESALGGDFDWVDEDHVRVCEYFRKVSKPGEWILGIKDPETGVIKVVKASLLPKDIRAESMADDNVLKRQVFKTAVEWYFIVGSKKVDHKEWAGKYIPVVPVIGEETVIDGEYDCKGHTRALLDPQRIYNYWASSAVEHVALQGKTPYIAPAEAIENYEQYWNNANRVNYSVLPYNALGDDGVIIPPPQRAQAPVMAPAYIQGMQLASQDMMYVSGQREDTMGMQGNERSGLAIQQRQRKGENATYHYINGLGVGIRQVGRIVLDLIPHIYDTQRTLQIMAEDGTDYEVEIDPQAKQAFLERKNYDAKVVQRVLNPNIGNYEVQADVGPGYATRREQAFVALTQIITQAPALTGIIGDILLKAGDFPMADEAAARVKRMVPKEALGEGPSAAEQQMQQQITTLQAALSATMDESAQLKLKLVGKDQLRDIDAFKAETDRLKVMVDPDTGTPILPVELRTLFVQLIKETMATPLTPVVEASQDRLAMQALGGAPEGGPGGGNGDAPPVPNARKAPDGQWYVDDPTRPGKFLHVPMPGA